ncbi:MAG: cytochrome [Ramlibacter sp.]|nr:cytochrome [Ramlibacter sp.]
MSGEQLQVVRVWDLPTRLFHWALVLCVIGLLVTGKIGGEAMVWHSRIGYAAGSLLLFRLVWGLAGGHWSRFATFTHSPRVVLGYLRGKTGPHLSVGHTPLGALSVYALLIFLLAQVATGLFSDDTADFSGPLSVLVSNRTVKLLTGYHKNIGQVVLIVLVLLHVAAVAYYHLRKGQNLIGPMLRGDKELAFPAPASRDDTRSRLLALVVLALSCAAIAWLVSLGGP